MILLDTHVLVWLVADPRRLSRTAAAAIRSARSAGGIGIASISLWEIAMLFVHGRLRARGTVDAAIGTVVDAAGVVVKEITPAIAALAAQFPEGFPRDPADRLIGATARSEGLALVTRDAGLRASALLKTIW